jgi:antirestriction protein ArdC
MTEAATRSDIYQRVTDALVRQLEQGTRPWMKPWNAEHLAGKTSRPLRACGKPYRGINVLILWLTAVERRYSAPIWMTFKQAAGLGAHVRKGEMGMPIAYADSVIVEQVREGGAPSGPFPFGRFPPDATGPLLARDKALARDRRSYPTAR